MLVVTNGKVVVGHNVYNPGDVIDCLSPEEEERMIAEGLACSFDGDADGNDLEGEPEEAAMSKPLTAAQLKARCKELGLPTNGKKDELQARIDEFEAAEDGEADDDDPPILDAEVPR